MNLRKEHVVLGGTLATLGLLYYASPTSPGGRGGSARSGNSPVLEDHPVPDIQLALPSVRKLGDSERDVFAPPRDTIPLPPLDLDEPPLPRFIGLRPPPEPALDPALFARFLRTETSVTPVAGLFAVAEEVPDDATAPAAPNGAKPDATEVSLLTPDQRAVLVESYKKRFDWIQLEKTELLFGSIRNPDRYGLRERSKEDVLFVEVLPESGQDRFPGQKPVSFARARVTEFAFADNASNRIQVERRRFAGALSQAQIDAMLEFANECVELRYEAGEALKVAEELFNKAAAAVTDRPEPRLGLARCFEAGFRFQEAYIEYALGRPAANGDPALPALIARFPNSPEVHMRLAQLEARLRMFTVAEERLRTAEQVGGRGQWTVQHAFGQFLVERGRFGEAVPKLREAFRLEPARPEDAKTRARIRTDLGRALLATGAADEALTAFDKALQADATDQRAMAGKLGALSLGAKGAPAAAAALATGVEFDYAIERALNDLAAKNWQAACDGLMQAATTDPLRAPHAWRALSWLAEITGYPEDALRLAEMALEGDPSDAWTLYQAGRLLADKDDAPGARDMFLRALEVELDFVDALVALGVLAYRANQTDDAERYFERALAVEPTRAEIHALRGINLISAGELPAARTSFEAALAVDRLHPLAGVGLAWTTYRANDSEKAITQFAELNDNRRALPESDAFRVFAKAQMARIQEHESKVVWSDDFQRLQLKNDWDVEEAAGPTFNMVDNALQLEGTFNTNGVVRVTRQYAAGDFVAVEMDITVPASCNARVGLFVAKEKRLGSGQMQAESKFGIARRRDGALVVLLMDTATADEAWEDVPAAGAAWWPADKPVRVRIEKLGDGNESRGRILIDGVAVREGFKLPRLAASTKEVKLGVFCEGQTGLPAKVIIDNVKVTKRIRK